jgi:hypothetical protein
MGYSCESTVAKEYADAECPDGKELDLGLRIRIRSSSGDPTGRDRRNVLFTTRLIDPDVNSAVHRHRTAALRPHGPPRVARAADAKIHRREKSDARLSRATSGSRAGVWVRRIDAAIA